MQQKLVIGVSLFNVRFAQMSIPLPTAELVAAAALIIAHVDATDQKPGDGMIELSKSVASIDIKVV